MQKNAVFYDLSNDTAFRVVSYHADRAQTKAVEMATGRSKGKEITEVVISELYSKLNACELLRIQRPKDLEKIVEEYRLCYPKANEI